MSIVNTKCTHCGASIQLDSNQKEGFCSYCGSKIKIQDSIGKVQTSHTANLSNYLNIAGAAIDAGNGEEALEYANKALEADSQSAEAWLVKMQAYGLLCSISDFRYNDIATAGKRVLEYDDSEDTKWEVYNYYLEKCRYDLNFFIARLSETDEIKKLYQENLVTSSDAPNLTFSQDVVVQMCMAQEENISRFRSEIPPREIKINRKLTQLAAEVAELFISYQNTMNTRLNVYARHVDDAGMTRYKKYLEQFKQGLSDEMQNTISEDRLTKNLKGCYIATAVYGSYDSAEVCTLRRFRDHALARTWYGRAFIRMYYAVSPLLIRYLGQHKWFRTTCKAPLDSLVDKLLRKGYDNSPYNDL